MTRVRDATREDLPALLAIEATSLEFPQPKLLRAGIRGPATVLVAGTKPVGYALAFGHEPTYLAELAVAPRHRGVGHGSALLAAVLARGECRLTVRADAERARRFYDRHGFRAETRLPRHYGDDDGIVLVCQPDSDPESGLDSASAGDTSNGS